MTSPTIIEFQPEFVTSGFQKPDLTYILSMQLFTNFILLNLFFCHLKFLCDAIRFMRHKVGAHKVCQITIISRAQYKNVFRVLLQSSNSY